MWINIWDVHQFIGHCLFPLDPCSKSKRKKEMSGNSLCFSPKMSLYDRLLTFYIIHTFYSYSSVYLFRGQNSIYNVLKVILICYTCWLNNIEHLAVIIQLKTFPGSLIRFFCMNYCQTFCYTPKNLLLFPCAP